MKTRNHFEMAAHDIQYRNRRRPSWDNTAETYTNRTHIDWFAVGMVAALIIPGLALIIFAL